MAGPRTSSADLPPLPKAPVERLTRPFVRFLHIEAGSGVLLLLCSVVALIAANSQWADAYHHFWEQHLVFKGLGLKLDYSLEYWINDGLMAIFFFVVGLEIKRELVRGELRDPRTVVLPVAAALGGAAIPAGVFLLTLGGKEGAGAWGVPMATDIAFVVGGLALLGARVPRGLKVFLLTLAIVDDILAVLIIALFYGGAVKVSWLIGGAAGLVMIALLNRLGVRSIAVYTVFGVFSWLCTLKSGVHPTVAGAVLGLMTPAGAWIARRELADNLRAALKVIDDPNRAETSYAAMEATERVIFAARESFAPLTRLETALHPWVAFLIMPVFALANAAVPIDSSGLSSPLALAVGVGLVVGKPVGIFAVSFLMVKSGLARLPENVTWPMMLSAGCLAGIGFTMSLFIAALALEGDLLTAAKTGVLVGSAISAVLGMTGLIFSLRGIKAPAEAGPDHA